MSRTLVQNNIVVKPSNIHGFGVFAKKNIVTGQIIEECYTLLTQVEDDALINYFFEANEFSAIPLGFGCIYNHSDKPNASYGFDAERQLMIYKAKRYIRAGEEIFISYGKTWFDGRPFSKKKVSTLRKLLNPATSFPLRVLLGFGGIAGTIQVIKYLSLVM